MEKRYYILLFFWVFITVFPQFLQLTREDSIGTIIKVVSLAIFLVISFMQMIVKRLPMRTSHFVLFICFVVLQIITNFIINTETDADVMISMTCCILFFFILYCQNSYVGINREQIYKLSTGFEIMLLYVCIMNFILYGDSIIPLLTTMNSDMYNIDSVFFNRTNFASFLLVSLIMLIMKFKSEYGNKFIQLILILLGSFNLLLTLARTSIFSYLGFIIVLFLLDSKYRMSRKIITLIAIVSLILLILFSTGAMDYVINVIIRPEAGVTHRELSWYALLDKLNTSYTYWLFGLGYKETIEAHNTVLGIIEKFGILGLLIYLVVFLQTILCIIRISRKTKEMGILFIAVFITFILTSFTEEFTPFMSSSMSAIWTFAAVALPLAYRNSLENDESNNIVDGKGADRYHA